MPRNTLLLTFALAWALCGLGGCDKPAATPAAQMPASAASTDEDAGAGDGYTYHIRYPLLQPEWHPLDHALRAYAAVRKKEFFDARKADDDTAGPGYSLDLEFNVARRTADFVSALTNGNIYTGGAHGMPIIASFNLHPADGKLVTIEDLFADPQAALTALSDECRRQLEGRNEARLREATPDKNLAAALKGMRETVANGTKPTVENFDVFLIDGLDTRAIGLTLIFPPYQVASYADGTQQVEVPAKVFYALLKPEYRDAFQIDTEATKLAPGVR